MDKLIIEFTYIDECPRTGRERQAKDCLSIEHSKAKEIADAYNYSSDRKHYAVCAFISDMVHSFVNNIHDGGNVGLDVLRVTHTPAATTAAAAHRRTPAPYSREQARFHGAFPDKPIDCEVPAHVDIDKLIGAIKVKPFLRDNSNISLKSCVNKYYEYIQSNAYKPFKNAAEPDKKNDFMRREYTKEQLDAMYTRVEDFEV